MSQISKIPTNELVALPGNAREHTAEQISAIRTSIERYGWLVPVLVDEQNMIIAGHARVEAAREMEADFVPCITATGWSDEQKRAYSLVDNRISDMSSWDQGNLERELSYLKELQITASDLWLDMPDVVRDFQVRNDILKYTPEQLAKALHKQDRQRVPKTRPVHEITCPNCQASFEGQATS